MARIKPTQKPPQRLNRTLFIDFGSEERYLSLLEQTTLFVAEVVSFLLAIGAELLHKAGCPGGFALTRQSCYQHRRLGGLTIWRVQCKRCMAVFTVLSRFVMRHRALTVTQAEPALIGLMGGASFDTLSMMLSVPVMTLYRMFVSFGQVDLVGVLLIASVPPPQFGVPDEKHTWRLGDRHYMPISAIGPLFWAIDLVESASEKALEPVYAGTVQRIDGICGSRTVKGVTTDGFLPNVEFCARLRHVLNSSSEPIPRGFRFAHRMRVQTSMNHPELPRTSLWVDWLCNFLHRKLFMTRTFHRGLESGRRLVKAYAVLHNFMPYGPRARNSLASPVEVAGGQLPAPSWLASLQILSAGGLTFRKPP